ncbi:MAG: heme lyase CcmF/NrfE family subunit [bacterium]|nr:heme lyase CcmF/NrfE family subunit [bacterium]
MIPELGLFLSILALVMAVASAGLGFFAAARRYPVAPALAASGAVIQCVLMLASFACLATAFLRSDFSVMNVAANSSVLLPAPFRFAATWGSHEGSLLLWITLLSVWSAVFAVLSGSLPPRFRTRVMAVLSLLLAAFLVFMLTTSSPFLRLLPAATEGRDLNPLLQDALMVIHPPMLYMGYVGFAVSFAFAVAALIEGRLDAVWARWARPWTAAAWAFLTIGILLGSSWAYRELGWGGWWFWDPVENASLMPWLAGTALIHSLAVTDKRDSLKSWTLLLAIITFSLSILGTFLVRSGVLTSVHAFATDPQRGVFILVLLLGVIGSSFGLYAWRMNRVGLGGRFAPVSRESFLLLNNLLMMVALAAVMTGTLYPLFLDVLGLGKISVGPPYFETVIPFILLPAVFLMAAGPFARWKKVSLAELLRPLRLVFLAALAVVVLLPWWMGRWSWLVALGIMAATWLAFGTLAHLQERLSRHSGTPLSQRLAASPLSYYGMLLAHAGIAVFIFGVTLVQGYGVERDVVMTPGQTVSISDWRITFVGVDDVKGPNYVAAHGVFELTRDEGRVIYLLEPQKRHYLSGDQTMTEAAIDSGFFRDIYIALGEPVQAQSADAGKNGEAWSVRLYFKPFVNWIWGGCLMMALGGFLAVLDRRYRRPAVALSSSTGAAP